MLEATILAGCGVLAALLAAAFYVMDRGQRRESVYRWASGRGFRLVNFRQPWLTEMSPFPLSVSKAQQVFHVEVVDSAGRKRSGWVRLGDPWRGLASDRAEVRWRDA